MKIRVVLGDCLEKMKELPDNSVDAVVTDPPYELGFMGKDWDNAGIAYNVAMWRECLRVLKPGGYLLSFGGTRTHHRMVCAIEDTGFEIRDSIHWIYGSGFPKSFDVSKSIDKRGGVTVGWFGPWLKEERERRGMTRKELAVHFPSQQKYAGKEASGGLTGCVGNWETGVSLPTVEQFNKLCDVLNLPFKRLEEARREVLQSRTMIQGGGNAYELRMGERREVDASITAPATDAARQWSGWGTALKPSHEPIVVARKPLIGKVAENILAHGTGALNIDGCRIKLPDGANAMGRWPSNTLFSHLPECAENTCAEGCAVAELDAQSDDSGGASRFFPMFRYQAKASRRERGEGNTHPTVKPVELMRWLVRLVTPPGGLILDPFTGSGTTGVAAKLEGFQFIGIEQSPEYHKIAMFRIAGVTSENVTD